MPTGIYRRSDKEKERLIKMIKTIGYVPQKGKRLSPITEFKKGLIPWNKGRAWIEMRGKNHPSKKAGLVEKFKQIGRNIPNRPIFKGENHPQWKGGKTPLVMKIRNSPQYVEWREKVFKRDNYTCKICKDSTGGNLNAHHKIRFSTLIHKHHIKSFEQAMSCNDIWDLSNGITLCEHCHSIANEASKIIEILNGG